jgi:curved DNA-binding protein
MAFIDYYKILGVDRNIPQKDVRRAFLKRAKQFHPDLHPDDPKAKAKFQALNEAYEVIGDPEKRKKYDQYGQNWKEADAFNQAGGNAGGGTEFHWSSSGGGSPFDGFDFSSFGSGGGGFSSFFEDLFGHGAGHGFSSRYARTSTGEMNAKVNIDLYTALLGGEVIIQLSNGSKIKLKVKPETQNGTRVRLRGKGYDRGDGTYGDLIITYNVTLPTNLSDRQKQLLNEMRYAG